MNLQKHIPTFARWFQRKHKQVTASAGLPTVKLEPWWPQTALKTVRKRTPSYYIPTKESPWAVISLRGGRWTFEAAYYTREAARRAIAFYKDGIKRRVVRAIIPTR